MDEIVKEVLKLILIFVAAMGGSITGCFFIEAFYSRREDNRLHQTEFYEDRTVYHDEEKP